MFQIETKLIGKILISFYALFIADHEPTSSPKMALLEQKVSILIKKKKKDPHRHIIIDN